MRVVTLALALVLLPSVVRADEIARDANAVAALNAVDYFSTRAVLRARGYEVNPLARPFVQSNGTALLYFTTSSLLSNVLARKLGPRWGRIFLGVQAGSELVAITHNLGYEPKRGPTCIWYPVPGGPCAKVLAR